MPGIRMVVIIMSVYYVALQQPPEWSVLGRGQFWVRSTASVHDSLWELRLLCTVFIQDSCRHDNLL